MARKLLLFHFITLLVITGCSTYKTISSDEGEVSNQEIDYRIIYYIHGDSDYLFHNREGVPTQADQVAITRAVETAEEAKSGEVMIFHHQPKSKWAGLFSRRSNRFYHYKEGVLIHEAKYKPEKKDEPFLATEYNLYQSFDLDSGSDEMRNFFLFFGHEIPAETNQRYHASYPDISVSVEAFSDGISQFINGNDKYDLTVLSSCSNGSPEMARHLMPVTNVVLASPQNLHLSHIRPQQLSILETMPGAPAEKIAEAIAEQTYRELSSSIQTVITLSVYRLNDVESYIGELNNLLASYYDSYSPDPFRENRDCAELGIFEEGTFGKGVKTFFRAPAFGRESNRKNHSGWGCKPAD